LSFTFGTFRCSGDLPTNSSDSLIQYTPFKVHSPSQPQSVQVEPSDPSKGSQQVTVPIKALPLVPIVHLKRFLHDSVAGGKNLCKTRNKFLVFTVVRYRSLAYYYYFNRGGISVDRRNPSTPNRSHGSRRASKAAESSASSSDATSANMSSFFRSSHAPSGPGTTVVGGGHRKAAPAVPHAISLENIRAGWASCIHRKESCMTVVERRKCTIPRCRGRT